MGLIQLDFDGLRNLASARIEPGPSINLIVGPNASGKTSLLESIYLLGRARSFRTRQILRLIQSGRASLTVAGWVETDPDERTQLGLLLARGKRELRVDGRPARSSLEFMRQFPLLVIQPSGIALVEGPPGIRRHFLDFGVFHQDPGFMGYWRRYGRAVQQRNSLLRAGRRRELSPWSQEMVSYGIMLHSAREAYVQRLTPFFAEIATHFFPGRDLTLQLVPGWDSSRSLGEVLEAGVEGDLRQGFTQQGPHRVDFILKIDQRPVREFLSRGQTKLLVYALLLAQSRLMEDGRRMPGCVLIDDVASELDVANRARLMGLLANRASQFFITATALEPGLELAGAGARVYELSEGRIARITER